MRLLYVLAAISIVAVFLCWKGGSCHNMPLKQSVIQKGITFEVKLNPSTYIASEAVQEVEAALQMEGMKLEEDELELLSAYHEGKLSGNDIRRQILNEV